MATKKQVSTTGGMMPSDMPKGKMPEGNNNNPPGPMAMGMTLPTNAPGSVRVKKGSDKK